MTSGIDFKASVKLFLKRYSSELWSAKLLVVLLVKYCLEGSFRCCIFRWIDLSFKWSIESLQYKVTYNNNGIHVVYICSIFTRTRMHEQWVM